MELAQTIRGVRRPPLTPGQGPGVGEKRVGVAVLPMSHPCPASRPPPPPPPVPAPQQPAPLFKQKSWSPDAYRDEAWLRRKGNHDSRRRRSKSVTDEDLDELKACIELGFGFESPEVDQRLSDTLPALGLYYSVNKQYYDNSKSSSTPSECDSPSIFDPSDNPQAVKTRLRQWAQMVACSVRQSSSG